MSNLMPTTIDNPWNPYKNWDEWYAFDQQKGYCTWSLIARICSNSDSLSEKENEENIDLAIEELLSDPLGIYAVIGPEDTPRPVQIDTGEGV